MTVHQIPPETDEDDEFEEPENAVLRRELDLRPTHYPDIGAHPPDQLPCPSWCWIAQNEGYDHEVNPTTPWMLSTGWRPSRASSRACTRGTNLAL